ncbi:MAG: 1-deoxy-D-xylulose-5-phosphate synthase N-terminal domain-containing protein [Planctomycetaceae bacterium]
MEFPKLSQIQSPRDIKDYTEQESTELAQEIREVLYQVVSDRTAHFASNLGVVELCIALHQIFDFSKDRLIWDTGHQIYPHKLITGRFHEFTSIRNKGA